MDNKEKFRGLCLEVLPLINRIFLEAKMVEAGIEFNAHYADVEE